MGAGPPVHKYDYVSLAMSYEGLAPVVSHYKHSADPLRTESSHRTPALIFRVVGSRGDNVVTTKVKYEDASQSDFSL